MWRQLRPAAVVLLVMTALTGLVYPLVVTGVGQGLLPHQANGSLIWRDGRAVGSELIGQSFDDPRYFWGRLSATSPPYNAAASSGSNQGPMSPALAESAKARLEALRKADPGNAAPVPVDLATSSGSGLDPHIGLKNAFLQARRVAPARGIGTEALEKIIRAHTEGRDLGIFGEPRVNVLRLNLALDKKM